MKDADDALSRRARAVTEEPSGANARTLHVMSSVLTQIFAAVCDELTGVGALDELGVASVEIGDVSFLSIVWWGF